MTPIQAFQDFLWSQEEKITKSLPKHITAKRFISSVCAYLEAHPKVVECNRGTILDSIMKAAQVGLIIDGVESALVPRKSNCTLMMMFQGLLKLVRNSGELKDIQSAVVYEKDEFDYYTDENGEHLKHKRSFGDRGKRVAVYAIARTKDGGTYVEVMDASQVEAVKKHGYNSGDSPWNGPFQDEMWRKSPVRRLAKRLPSSTDMETFGADLDPDDEPQVSAPEPVATTSSALASAVAASPVPDPVKNEPKAVKQTEAVKQPEIRAVLGVLEGVKEKDYPQDDGTTIKRFICLINGVSYGTCDAGFGGLLKSIFEFKSECHIKYQQVPREDGKFINEIVDVGGMNQPDQKPI